MLTDDPELFRQVRDVKTGRRTLPAPVNLFREWASEQYDIDVVHIIFDRFQIGPAAGRPRLVLVLETSDDCEKLQTFDFSWRPDVERSLLRQFAAFVSRTGFSDVYDTEKAHLVCDSFSNAAKAAAVHQFLKHDKSTVIEEFGLWEIDAYVAPNLVAFYFSKKHLKRGKADGTSNRIRDRCYEFASQYDEFKYFDRQRFPLSFDSKQNVDKNYQGNLFYYFR